MGITKEELNLMEIFVDLGKICQTEAVCQKCAERGCLVGYSKDCAAKCRVKGQTYVENGFAEIPPCDIRGGYDEYNVLHAIAHRLLQCRGCKQEHYKDCLINVVRSCLEVIEFGEEQEYEGDPLSYMVKVRGLNPQKADIIAEEYKYVKDKRFMEGLKQES